MKPIPSSQVVAHQEQTLYRDPTNPQLIRSDKPFFAVDMEKIKSGLSGEEAYSWFDPSGKRIEDISRPTLTKITQKMQKPSALVIGDIEKMRPIKRAEGPMGAATTEKESYFIQEPSYNPIEHWKAMREEVYRLADDLPGEDRDSFLSVIEEEAPEKRPSLIRKFIDDKAEMIRMGMLQDDGRALPTMDDVIKMNSWEQVKNKMFQAPQRPGRQEFYFQPEPLDIPAPEPIRR